GRGAALRFAHQALAFGVGQSFDALALDFRLLQHGGDEFAFAARDFRFLRSEEHTSELQSQSNLVCRLLLEKKKNKGSAYYVAQVVCADVNARQADRAGEREQRHAGAPGQLFTRAESEGES